MSTTATFTVAAIAAVLADENYSPKQQGKDAIQVNLNTDSPAKGGISDGKRCRLLLEGCEKLKAAGYHVDEDESIRLSAPPTGENQSWRPWPSIWVNRNPRVRNTGGEAVIPVSSVASLLAAMGISKEQMAEAVAKQALSAELAAAKGTVAVATPAPEQKTETTPADAGGGQKGAEDSDETPF